MLYTLLVIVAYSFTFTYILLSRDFRKEKYSAVCTEFLMGSKFHFLQSKNHFSQLFFIDKYLKFQEVEYLIHYIKFEMYHKPYFM